MKAFAATFVVLWGFSCSMALLAEPVDDSDRRLSTGVTGMITSRGLENPFYVLNQAKVQALILRISEAQITASEARSFLAGGAVSLDDLLELELVRLENDVLRLNYLVLTAVDRHRIRETASRFGVDLADVFQAKRAEFDALVADWPQQLQDDLRFVLIAGFILNWDGLNLTTEMGLRAAPRAWPNGDRYLIHSSEFAEALDTRALYWGSHTYPGSVFSFSTLGDSLSHPRGGLPNIVEAMAEGLEPYSQDSQLHGASVGLLLAYMTPALEHAGMVMGALAGVSLDTDALQAQTGIPKSQFGATIQLLESAGYIRRDNAGLLAPAVVVLRERDTDMLNKALALGRKIVSQWLSENYEAIERDLEDLTPSRHDLPFELVFSEVWHDIFGMTAKTLAEQGMIANPYEAGTRFEGFVPFVWRSSLYDQ